MRAPKHAIERFTRHAGRMAPLPEWLGGGAVLGVQGGTDVVRAKLERVRAFDVPVAAFWLQDWEGQRQTIIGQQLWWNWVLDRERYPGWEELVADLAASDIRVMTYVNPFLVDVAERGDATRNLFREAVDAGYLVKRADGTPYLIPNTSFSAGLLDLTNPATRGWFADVLRDEVLGVGASGWMLDFGEALPFDAVLASGESPATAHNRYPEDWAELARQAVADAGRADDVVFFTRSGFTRSPAKTRLLWLGDQLVSFDGSDGLASAVKGLLSGGISGFALNHGDVGGYTSVSILGVTRSKELLLRWMELGAFEPVFRTHEGNQPAANVQFDTDDETLAQLARCTKIFQALGFHRRALMDESATTGVPLLRHPWLEFPDDAATLALTDHVMLGADILVVPVTHAGASQVSAYLPAGRWVHVWSGRSLGEVARGVRVTVDAPIGEPAVFHREGSEVGAAFVANLRAVGVLAANRP
ncbi:MAG: alpha-glucosidase [Deltaproteobacteria bacterium]|nr:alpha-glucosidase [Deltaproteobacteria bacterium]